jgi:hypothetical protein
MRLQLQKRLINMQHKEGIRLPETRSASFSSEWQTHRGTCVVVLDELDALAVVPGERRPHLLLCDAVIAGQLPQEELRAVPACTQGHLAGMRIYLAQWMHAHQSLGASFGRLLRCTFSQASPSVCGLALCTSSSPCYLHKIQPTAGGAMLQALRTMGVTL